MSVRLTPKLLHGQGTSETDGGVGVETVVLVLELVDDGPYNGLSRRGIRLLKIYLNGGPRDDAP